MPARKLLLPTQIDGAIGRFNKAVAAAVKAGDPLPKDQRVSVGGVDGLQVYLRAKVAPSWALGFEHPRSADGTRNKRCYTVGRYSELSLQEAREKALEYRKMLSKGINPRRTAKRALEGSKTFADVAALWFDSLQTKSRDYQGKVRRWLAIAGDSLNDRPIATLTAKDIEAIILPLCKTKIPARIRTARNVLFCVRNVFELASDDELMIETPSLGRLTRIIGRSMETLPATKPRPAIVTPHEFGALLRALGSYQPDTVTGLALQLLPLVFLRVDGEFRRAEWSEINFDGAVWTLPANRTKLKRELLVPLSHQALALLRRLHALTGAGEHIFASGRAPTISEGALTHILHTLGFRSIQTSHGFRASFQTLCKEQGIANTDAEKEAIALQLGHWRGAERSMNYDRSKLIEVRRVLMQDWADLCDRLKLLA